jgi:hypothetical protein
MGHFVMLSTSGGNSFVGQITRRYNDPNHSQHFVTVVPYLPLYSLTTQRYISNPTLLPLAVTHLSCHHVTELVTTSCTTVVSISDIIGLAFIFLADSVTIFMNHLQGMTNAFIIRFKYSHGTSGLSKLSDDSFHCFPDLHTKNREFWSECYGRSIFTSIDYLWQEIWRVLCRYGQSQGMYPKDTISLFFPTVFTQSLCHVVQTSGVTVQECFVPEPQRRVEVNLIYRMVSTQFKYLFFTLDTDVKINSLTGIIGSMSVFGIRKWMKQRNIDSISVMRVHDLVNVFDKIDLYVNSSRIKLRLFAFRHQVGQPTTLMQLLTHIGNPEPQEERAAGCWCSDPFSRHVVDRFYFWL